MRRRLVLAGAAVSVVIAGALVVLVILLLRREPDKPAPAGGPASARIQPLPAPTEFVPDADPQATAHATVQASAVAIVALPDGARCVLPPGAAKPGSECRVSRLRNSPPRRGALELLSSAYEFSVDSAEDPLAATITLPFAPRRRKSAAPVALAAWNGVEWRPVASVVDGSTVTARVTHFSTYAVVSTPRFEAGPAEVYLSSLPGQGPARIPRGATVECVILRDPTGPAGRYDRVKLVGEENVEFGDGKGGFLRGEGTVQDAEVMGYYGVRGPGIEDVAKNVNEFRFQMRVPPGAPLGLRGIELSGSQVETLRYENAFDVCAPLVVIVDIDGMRQDVFYHAIQNPPAGFVHIPKLAGARTSAGADSIEFQHGVALRGAVTVFPTVTFAGHAAIFSGTDPGRYKIAGNEWFDRTLDVPYKFAFTGDNQGETGMGDSYDSFINGVANRRLLASGVTTVYQDAQREFGYRSVVAHNMYYGDGASAAAWASYGRLDMLLYLGKPKWLGGLWLLTPLSDRHMAAKARRAVLARDRYVTLGDQIGAEDARSLAIVTLYFAGLDHVSHESGSPRTVADPAAGYSGKQLDYLVESVDPYVGGFLESMTDVTYKNTTFIFVADHGQTTMNVQEGERGAKIRCFAQSRRVPTLHKFQDLLYETGYFPAGTYTLTGLDSGGTQIPARPVDASAVVGLNGGMAHVYLRRLAVGLRLEPPGPSLTLDDFTTRRSRVNQIFEAWRQPPRFQHVLDFAEAVRRWQEENPPSPEKAGDPEAAGYYRSLDLILVRDGEHGGFDAPYSVYVGPGNLVPFQEYLARNGNRPFSEPRYGWTSDARDIAFLADRLRRLQSAMSGDLILVPRYPDFYCEYVPLHGDHGGFTRSDFEVPFLVVRPGEAVARPLADAVRRSVDLSTKNRPSITDVKALVLNLLRPPAQATSTAGACEVLRRARDKIYSPVKRGAKAVSVLATPILPAPDPEDRDARPRPLCRAVRLHWKAPDRAMAEILDPDKDQLRTPRDVDAARFVIAGQMFPYFFHDVNPVFAFLQICDRGPSALPGFGEFSAEDAVRTLAARIGRDAATVRAAFPPVDAYLALETAEGRRTVTLDMKAYLSAFFHSLRALVPSDRADLLREMGGGGDEIGQYLQIATIEADDRFSELRLSISAKDGGGSAPTTMTYELRDGLFLLLSQLVHAPDDSKGGEDKPDAFEAVTSYEYVTVHGVALPSKFTIVARSLKGGRVLKQTTSFGLAFSEHRVDSPPPDEAFDAFDRLYGTIRKEQFAEMRERIRKMKETNPDWSAADAEKRLREEEEKPPKRWNPWR